MKKLLLSTLLSSFLIVPFIANPAMALKPYEQDMINVYKNVSPSVVSIMTVSYDEESFMEPVPKQGAGSGVVIDKEGHILTNNHVIQGSQKIDVLFGKKSYPAKIVGRAENYDLAILKVAAPADVLKPAKLGDSSKLQIGQTAIAIGNPFGILGRTMTTGIISALNRDIKGQGKILKGMIQTDAAINPGNSGGALVNSSGEVIGINTMIFSQSGGSVGIGFSIPINLAKKYIPSLIKTGTTNSPWLGVKVLGITPVFAQQMGYSVNEGVLVLESVSGGAAQKAGIKGGSKFIFLENYKIPINGDIIVALDNEKITTPEELTAYLENNKDVGDNIAVKVVRGSKVFTINLKLQARPKK
ncbi:MAG: trypsin-like peptidase domain-containing protein [Candidatus Sericytochromatia bacterium]